jgi:predicted alpha/beta-fold hydrolase
MSSYAPGDSNPRLDDGAKLISGIPFEPHPLLKSGHAQTVAGWAWPRPWRPRTLRRVRTMDEERLFKVEPGVRLLARCRWQEDRISSPTLILVHGLGGSDASPYVMGTAELSYAVGMNVVRLNQRNCGNTEHITPTLYHSGLSGDLRGVVAELLQRDRLSEVLVCGFSMGGNLALKMAGELGEEGWPGLVGMCAISPPVDLSETAKHIERPFNRLYQWRFVNGLKRMMVRKKEQYPKLYDLHYLKSIHTIRQFDELYTAPHGDFSDAEDYYARASALPLLSKIRVPTLILHARDDPLVPLAPSLSTEASENPNVLVVTPHRGGHVGFVSGEGKRERFWAEAIVVNFCRALSSLPEEPQCSG